MLCFGGSRTFHRIAVAIEDAGFELRDTVMWVYGSGFPKSHDVSKAIDKEAGATRMEGYSRPEYVARSNKLPQRESQVICGDKGVYTLPATDAAKQWQGWGTALKPAFEPIILARKPLEGTVANNVLKYGTGAINIDGCRVAHNEECKMMAPSQANIANPSEKCKQAGRREATLELKPAGRWPANFIHDGSEEVLELMPNDSARFYYSPKASKKDRDEGCEGLEEKQYSHDGRETTIENAYQRNNSKAHNHHPTVKPTSLMRYLCKLITPPNGTILDPFMGSGSTGKAAMLEGFNFVGIEREQEYVEIAEARIGATTGASVAVIEERSQIPGQLTLF